MRCRHARGLIVGTVALLAINFASGGASIAQDETIAQDGSELLTEAPSKFRIEGRLFNEQQVPVAGARVTLIPPHGGQSSLFSFITRRRQTLSTQSDLDGKFALEFAADDEQFLGASRCLLMVRADNYATRARQVSFDRMLIDLPIELTLERCQPMRLRLLDADQQPVSGAAISPARVNSWRLPLNLETKQRVKTDASGWVDLEGYNGDNLQAIYVETENRGNQQLEIAALSNHYTATMMPRGTVNASFRLPDGVDPEVLDGQQLLIVSIQQNSYMPSGQPTFSWEWVKLDRSGKFSTSLTALGRVLVHQRYSSQCPFGLILPRRAPRVLSAERELQLQFELEPLQEIVLKFVDGRGRPLPRLAVTPNGVKVTQLMTDDNGNYSIWDPEGEKLDGQLWPRDPLGRHQVVAGGGVVLSSLKLASKSQAEPIELTRSRALVGRVIDSSGNAVAGAKIDYSYAVDGWRRQRDTLSDKSGRFRLRRLPPDSAVQVTAQKGNLATSKDEPVSALAGDPREIELVLRRRASAAPIGRVVDHAGNPVAGATVRIGLGKVVNAEGYGSEELYSQPLYQAKNEVTTNADGIFRYPATPQFEQRLQLTIEAPGYFRHVTPFLDGARRDVAGGELYLGEFQLIQRPATVETEIRCVDAASGNAIDGAELVFIGAQAGRTSATTSEEGTLTLQLADTAQVVAVKADGYQVRFRHITSVPEELTFSLQPAIAAPPQSESNRLRWFERGARSHRKAAKDLLSRLDKPLPGESTYYRQALFFKAQADADSARFYQTLVEAGSEYAHRDSIVRLGIESLIAHSPRQSLAAVTSSDWSASTKVYWLARLAFAVRDGRLKEDLYGEALVELSNCAGDELLVATGYLARFLILDNRIAAARSIVQSAWESAENYHQLIKNGGRQKRVGESRIFGPMLAILDLGASYSFLEATGPQRELAALKDQGLVYLSVCDWEEFRRVCDERDVQIQGDGVDRLLRYEKLGNGQKHLHLVPWAKKVVALLDDSIDRMQLSLFVARHLPPGIERYHFVQTAVTAWQNSSMPHRHLFAAHEYAALQQIVLFPDLQRRELDELLFVCLERMPDDFESYNTRFILAYAARLLAMRDANLARQLLEPAFKDSVWYARPADRLEFAYNRVLRSVAWVDPAWARDLAIELSEEYSLDEPVRELEIFSTIINELRKVSITQR